MHTYISSRSRSWNQRRKDRVGTQRERTKPHQTSVLRQPLKPNLLFNCCFVVGGEWLKPLLLGRLLARTAVAAYNISKQVQQLMFFWQYSSTWKYNITAVPFSVSIALILYLQQAAQTASGREEGCVFLALFVCFPGCCCCCCYGYLAGARRISCV